jgi:hypothetical protein
MEYRAAVPPMPANSITLAHFSVSPAISFIILLLRQRHPELVEQEGDVVGRLVDAD